MEGTSGCSVLSVLGSLQFTLMSLVSSVVIAKARQLKDSGSSQEMMISLPLFLTTSNKDLKDLEASTSFSVFRSSAGKSLQTSTAQTCWVTLPCTQQRIAAKGSAP